MKQIKYYLFIIFVLLLELGITVLLYLFATSLKPLFVGISLLLLLSTLFYLLYSRFLERIKVKPKKEVLAGYRKGILTFCLVIGIILAVLILVKSASLFFRF